MNCSGPARNPPESHSLVIFPGRTHYIRPEQPGRARQLTPAKVAGIAGIPVDADSDFMAIFEITSTADWVKKLVPRLERRLKISLERAWARQPESVAPLGILSVVAVIGVVSVAACKCSVAQRVKPGRTPLLYQMMEAGRFVFMLLPMAGSPKP